MVTKKAPDLRRRSLDESLEEYARRTESPCTCNEQDPTYYPKRDFWRHRVQCLFRTAYLRWRDFGEKFTGLKHVRQRDEEAEEQKQVA
jgi:hypothetical protein